MIKITVSIDGMACGAVIVAAAAFLVLALCAGVKAVCRKLLEKN